jgi:hypothetical protein
MALNSTLIGTTNTTVYTSSVTGTQVGNAITSMIVCNYSNSTAATLTLYAVPHNGGTTGTAGNVNMIINALPIPAGETVSLDQEKLVLDPNDTIVAVSSQATTLTITISTLPV